MDVSPKEFVDRLLSEEAYSEPSDDCSASELKVELPPWHDVRKYRAGSKFSRDNNYAISGAQVIGLATVIVIPTILKVLVHTKKSSSSLTAYRRYASTHLHNWAWTREDLKPGSKAWSSLVAVRTRHLKAGRNARNVKIGTISQRDLAFTQFGFVGHVFLCPDAFGIQASDRDSWEGFRHVWATVGYMIGLKDIYNICCGTVEQTTEICRILMNTVFAPLLEFPPEPYEHMASVILDGLWSMMPLLDVRTGLFTVRQLAGVPGYVYTEKEMSDFRQKIVNGEIKKHIPPVKPGWHETHPRPDFDHRDFYYLPDVPEYKKLNFIQRNKFATMSFLSKCYSTYLGKIILNATLRFLEFLMVHFPILAFLRWGVSNSWVDMFKESSGDKTKPLSNSEVKEILDKTAWYKSFNVSSN